MRSAAPPLSPLLLAASRAQSWADVLRAYGQCQSYLQHTYTPTTAELQYGLSRMPSVWATSLFYYGLVKQPIAPATPETSLVLTALRRYKELGYHRGLVRVIEEDINTATLDGAKAKIALAYSSNMWEAALTTLLRQPKLVRSLPQRRTVLSTLSICNQWQLALQVLHMAPPLEMSPAVIRPIVRCFGRLRLFDHALRLTAASLAAGYRFDTALLSAVLTTLQETNQWSVALSVAQDLQLFSATRAEARRHAILFTQLVDCLYEADLYATHTLPEITQDVLARIEPRHLPAPSQEPRGRPFRLRRHEEVFQHFQSVLLPLSHVFSKYITIPRWYSRGIAGVAEASLKDHSTIVVVDTNFLLQFVQKNLTVDHFYVYMRQQYPDLQALHFATVVVPFTVMQETHASIWGGKVKLPTHVRTLLWSRVTHLVGQPNVYALSLAGEFPSTALGVLSKLAYSTMSGNVAGHYQHDPDLRILNVCLSLQHYLRMAQITHNMGQQPPLEGVALFSLLKYHVRRHHNLVKGHAVDQLLLCTMDRRMSQAAQQLGIRVFPSLASPS